jgi:hypothetical protein
MSDQKQNDPEQAAPAAATLELGTGFRDDDVTVLLDGREVWHGSGVTTNYSVGIATVVPLPAPDGPDPVLEVRVGDRARGTQRVELTTAAGQVRLRADLDPAGAMGLGPAPEGPIY